MHVSKLSSWFKMPSFYIFGLCYMGVRLYSNLFGTLLPFYLVYVLKLGGDDSDEQDGLKSIPFIVALIPLIIYLSSVCTSFLLSLLYEKIGRKLTLMAGGIICIGTAVLMLFLTSNFSWPIYIVAVLIGKLKDLV